jgi:hypothetical protein
VFFLPRKHLAATLVLYGGDYSKIDLQPYYFFSIYLLFARMVQLFGDTVYTTLHFIFLLLQPYIIFPPVAHAIIGALKVLNLEMRKVFTPYAICGFASWRSLIILEFEEFVKRFQKIQEELSKKPTVGAKSRAHPQCD